jgi:hypothetical protein
MGYYTRVLTTKESCVPVAVLSAALSKSASKARIHSDVDTDVDDWEQLTLSQPDGCEIASIERSVVEEGSLGEAEIQEFEDELDTTLPESSGAWLREFFPRVRCVYSFQHLSGSHSDEGFGALQAVRNSIWAQAPAIIQADGEGFTNEDGYQITWDFSESVTGAWWMGLLREGKWVHFQMDLGNSSHRTAFKNGGVPAGVKLA